MSAPPTAATGSTPARTVARRHPDELTPHPELTALFGEPPDEEVARLAHLLRAGHIPDLLVQATPGGRVVYGYPVILAARRAGLDEIEVVVREDLASQDDCPVALSVIDAALERGNLSPLGIARWLRRAHQLIPTTPPEALREYQLGTLDQQVARRLGVSPRNAQRYPRLLRAPPEVQAAYEAGRLTLVAAGQAACFPPAQRADLTAAIRTGEDPRRAVARFLTAPVGRHIRVTASGRDLARDLQRVLGRHLDQVKVLAPGEALDRAVARLQQLRSATPVVGPEQQAAGLRDLRRRMG